MYKNRSKEQNKKTSVTKSIVDLTLKAKFLKIYIIKTAPAYRKVTKNLSTETMHGACI